METTIFLGREILSGDVEALRRILRAHTQCDRSATELLLSVERERRERAVSHCVLQTTGEPSPTGQSWAVRFAYAD